MTELKINYIQLRTQREQIIATFLRFLDPRILAKLGHELKKQQILGIANGTISIVPQNQAILTKIQEKLEAHKNQECFKNAVSRAEIIPKKELQELVTKSMAHFKNLLKINEEADVKHQISDAENLVKYFEKKLRSKLKNGNYKTYKEYDNLIPEITESTMGELDGVSGLKSRKATCKSFAEEEAEKQEFLRQNLDIKEEDYISLYLNYPLDSSNMGVANEEGQHRGDKTIAEIGKAFTHLRTAITNKNKEVEFVEGFRIGGDEFKPRVRFKTREAAKKAMYFGIVNQLEGQDFGSRTATLTQKEERKAKVLIADMIWINEQTFEAADKESTLTPFSVTMVSKMLAMPENIQNSGLNWLNYIKNCNWTEDEKLNASNNLLSMVTIYKNFKEKFRDNLYLINKLRIYGSEKAFSEEDWINKNGQEHSKVDMSRVADWDILKPLFEKDVPKELLEIKNSLIEKLQEFGRFPFAFTLTSGYATHDQISKVMAQIGTSELPIPDFLDKLELEFKGTGTTDCLVKLIMTSTPQNIFWLLVYKDICKQKSDSKRKTDTELQPSTRKTYSRITQV